MLLFNVGIDEVHFSDRGYEWGVYWYEYGDYDGRGELVCLKDGLLYVFNLGHCSCYSYDESYGEGSFYAKVTVEEFLRQKDNIHDLQCRDEVEDKVRELLNR